MTAKSLFRKVIPPAFRRQKQEEHPKFEALHDLHGKVHVSQSYVGRPYNLN